MPPTPAIDINYTYLHTCLTWLDIRLDYLMQTWQLAGIQPHDYRGLVLKDEQAAVIAKRDIGSHWGSSISLPDEDEQAFLDAYKEIEQKIQAIEKQAEKNHTPLRLKAIKEIFELDDFEWWALIACLAPACDLRYEFMYGYLQDNVTQVLASADFILFLLKPDGITRLDWLGYFDPNAPLRRHRLILPVDETSKPPNRLRQAFQISPHVVNWLLGLPMPVHGNEVQLTLPQPKTTQTTIQAAPPVEILRQYKPVICLYGEDAVKKLATARQMAYQAQMPLLEISLNPAEPIDTLLEKLLDGARDSRLYQAILYIQKADILIDADGCLSASAFSAVRQAERPVVLATQRHFRLHPEMAGNDHPFMLMPCSSLETSERIQLWNSLLSGSHHHITTQSLELLGGQFNLASGQIIAAASAAKASSLQYAQPLQTDQLFEAARLHSGHHLPELANKVRDRYQWDDLVLPEKQVHMLQELVSMVQSRPQVLEVWGLGQKLTSGNGVSALFSGPPGTGKTLAAQIVAHQLGIDLYQIDLSTLISKYIGETEKNLEKIFSDASGSNAILFFDEADAIFGKRSEVKDAHDRYANIEVGYLLQRMETYNGITILATNLRGNLDEAFTRRLQFVIDFPFPDEEQRLQIWKVLMPSPERLPCSDDLNLRIMAERFKLAGGNIRNIIVSAAYLAASDPEKKLKMAHLLHGARREYQKMERILQEDYFKLP